MKNKKYVSLSKYQSKMGWIFITPWLIGFALFFMLPLFKSLYYSFCSITTVNQKMAFNFNGLEQYKFLFVKDPAYIRMVVSSVTTMLLQVPVIVFLSIFIASILAQDFRGNVFARGVFFLPVIIGTGIILRILREDTYINLAMSGQTTYVMQATQVSNILLSSGFSTSLVNTITNLINSIFELVWKMGIQIVLFLSTLRSIPKSYYEAADVEGSTSWENFWKITFPTVSPMILVCVVYTIVDSFTDYNNNVMRSIIDITYTQGRYAYGSAMSWVYFIVIFIIIILISRIVSKYVIYTEE